jgi:hypothetical protein
MGVKLFCPIMRARSAGSSKFEQCLEKECMWYRKIVHGKIVSYDCAINLISDSLYYYVEEKVG